MRAPAVTREITSVGSCADLPDAWDSLLGPDDALLDRRWLGVVERTAEAPMRYLLLHRDGELVAAVATAFAGKEAHWPGGRPDTLLAKRTAADDASAHEYLNTLKAQNPHAQPADVLMPALVAGGRHVGNTRVLLGPSAHVDDVEALVAEVERVGGQHGAASTGFLYVDERDTILRHVLAERGYASYLSAHYSRLTVPAGGIHEHIKTLSGARRRSILTELRRLAASDVSMSAERLTPERIAEFAPLDSALRGKYGVAWPLKRSEASLTEIADVYGNDAFAAVARTGRTVRGFGVVLRHRDRWVGRQVGFDHAYQEEQARLPLYFGLIYYWLIDEAARAGISVINYGTGSEEAKRSRGCATTDQHCFIKLGRRGDDDG